MNLILLLILVNVSGFLLKYFELDRHFFLIGFRLHLSLTLPLLFLFNDEYLHKAKQFLFKPVYKKYFLIIILSLFPVILLTEGLYLFDLLKIADPDYFYELGVSSLIDFPVYLIWNLPQLLILSLFLLCYADGKKYKFFFYFSIIAGLFIYEFVPLDKFILKENLFDIINFVSVILILSFFLSGIRNIYIVVLSIFSILWLNVLVFGNDSALLIQMLLGRNYINWEGFFSVNKAIGNYIHLMQLGLTFIFFLFFLMLNSTKNKKKSNKISINEKTSVTVSNNIF